MQQMMSWQCGHCGKAWSSEDACARCESACKRNEEESSQRQAAFEKRRDAMYAEADKLGAGALAIRLLLANGFRDAAETLAKEQADGLDDLGSGYVYETAVEHILAAADPASKEASHAE